MKKILFISCVLNFSISHAQFEYITEPAKLKGEVNSGTFESHPILSKDSSTIFFTRVSFDSTSKKKYNQDIWTSKKDASGFFVKPVSITKVNNELNNSIFGISSDGNTIYLFDCYNTDKKTVSQNGFATCSKKGDTWGEIVQHKITNLIIKGNHYDFHINNDENVILISYAGPSSLGEEDLYVSFKKDNIWSEPKHLGNKINSNKYDISPFLSNGQDTLFFSSNGFGGEGDADIFFSVRQDDSWTNWSTPQNLGNKINTPKFDAYFVKNGKNLYWSSSNDDTSNDDIYTSKLISTLVAKVDKVTNCSIYKAIDGKIDISVEGGLLPYSYVWSNGSTSEDASSLSKGQYSVSITDASGQKVELNSPISEPKEILNLTAGVNIAKIVTPEVVIFFNSGSWEILPEAAKELDRIVLIMNENPNLVIQLGSHTDCRSTVKFNKRLSNNRAASTAAYIKARINNPTRIYGTGYGESKLISNCPCEGAKISNCPEEEHKKNRRTEFIVISNEMKLIPKSDKITPKIDNYTKK